MSDFNYQKSYCVQALPAFDNLSNAAKNVHSKLIPLVRELNQDRNLSIPLNSDIEELIEQLSTKEIAELSRASYFTGHWQPSLLPTCFENKHGESWKIANCCDQVLRKRLSPLPHNIQIHEGNFRVTFSNKYCWLWEEFSLAIEENLATFKNCKLPFGENTLDKSANTLKNQIGDLWENVDNIPDNELYQQYLELVKEQEKQKVLQLMENAKAKADRLIKNAEIETIAYTWLLDNNLNVVDNIIYYDHKNVFCFGWRKPIQDKESLKSKLVGFPFPYEIK
ncbi:TPA: hypothetical protein DEP81_01310 [Candidatus Woesebacteria bacterium]|nr:hypothetical protein [Candidatus Woesebacteria bacterium]